MMGSALAAATVRKWYSSSADVGTYTIAGNTMSPAAPRRSASRAKRAAAAVVNSDTPAMTGTLPSLTSTAAASTLRFSSAVRELPSPTVPINTRPWTPSPSRAFCTRCVAGKSTSMAASNCVVAAGKTPDQVHDRDCGMGYVWPGVARGITDRIRCGREPARYDRGDRRRHNRRSRGAGAGTRRAQGLPARSCRTGRRGGELRQCGPHRRRAGAAAAKFEPLFRILARALFNGRAARSAAAAGAAHAALDRALRGRGMSARGKHPTPRAAGTSGGGGLGALDRGNRAAGAIAPARALRDWLWSRGFVSSAGAGAADDATRGQDPAGVERGAQASAAGGACRNGGRSVVRGLGARDGPAGGGARVCGGGRGARSSVSAAERARTAPMRR